MTGPGDINDDPFGSYEPTVGVAAVALEQAEGVQLVIDHIFALAADIEPDSSHPLTSYARSAAQKLRERVTETVDVCRLNVESARLHAHDVNLCHDAVERALDAYTTVCKLRVEALQIAEAMKTPDSPTLVASLPPLPVAKDWNSVSRQVEQDVLTWGSNNRGKKGQTLVLKPSPSAGKTYAMVELALQEQQNRQRVVFAVKTKELVEDTVDRVKKRSPFVRLHVIRGRDEETCDNYENVKAVQAHGYAPGRAVCFGCDYFPKNAMAVGLRGCEYYKSRIRAQLDTQVARLRIHDYPIIATTYASFVAATESGGQYGSFWPSDLLLFDEDPTDAFEPSVEIDKEHAGFRSKQIENKAANTMAALVRAAIDVATTERNQLRSVSYKDAEGNRSTIHTSHGSAYTGRNLHSLLERVVTGLFGQLHGVTSATQVLRDAADCKVQPGVGTLYGAMTTAAVNAILPPATLAVVAEALHDEIQFTESIRMLLHESTFGASPIVPTMSAAAMRKLVNDRADMHETSYGTVLECGTDGAWKLRTQQIRPFLDQGTNIVLGDAYAHVEHYRQLLDKPTTMPSNPAWIDPVTVIDHLAYFPLGTTILKVLTPSTITAMESGQWHDHSALIGSVLRQFEGKRVLVYGHLKLRERIEKLFEENNNFGIAEWAFEHWWGGRGKDQYRYFDAAVMVSEPIQNNLGMQHKVNARALRDAQRCLARGHVDDALQNSRLVIDETSHAHFAKDKLKQSASGRHWRIAQEHERQNVNELSQAIHRVRPLIEPRTVVIFGNLIPLTRDVVPASAFLDFRKVETRKETNEGCLTESQMYDMIEAIEDRFGIYSPAFSHAFLDIEMWIETGGFRSLEAACITGVGRSLRSSTESIIRRTERASYSAGTNTLDGVVSDPPEEALPELPGDPLTTLRALGDLFTWYAEQRLVAQRSVAEATVPLMAPTLLERVWAPPPTWQAVTKVARKLFAMKRAMEALNERVAAGEWATGHIKPTWADRTTSFTWYAKKRPGRNMVVSSLRCAHEVFAQYGPDGPTKPFVPF